MPDQPFRIDAAGWSGKTVALIGRIDGLPRRILVRHLEACGARVCRGLTRATDIGVVGHAARMLLCTGRLQPLLQRAALNHTRCISENTFLRTLCLLPAADDEQRTMPLDEIARLSGLAAEVLRTLALFDVITADTDVYGFRDLIAARTAARLLGQELALADVIGNMLRVHGDRNGSARMMTCMVRAGRSGAALQIGGAVVELNGQLRLPLPEDENPSADALYEAAVRAEDGGNWAEAERLYRRCFDLDHSDPSPAFNLANVLSTLNRRDEAQLYLRIAVAIDPAFTQAWYNLAHLAEESGDRTAARTCLERALDADADNADAVYNLAHLCWQTGDYAQAATLWERYLRLDAHGAWARKARHGLALCRMQLTLRPAAET